jgi:hypothetical protein
MMSNAEHKKSQLHKTIQRAPQKTPSSPEEKPPWTHSQFSLSKALRDWDEICKLDLPDQQKEKMQRFKSLLKELQDKLKQFE